MERLFSVIDQTAIILQKELSYTYLEALVETGENIFHNEVIQTELSELTKKRLMNHYSSIQLPSYANETIRKAYHLAILKGMKDHIQPNHQMTPDSIGYFISYLLGKFIGERSNISILDPAVGTGNLLMTVLNSHEEKINFRSIGIDVDDLLIKLAYVGANLQRKTTEFFNQDALEPLFIEPVDTVICDLPVGYYPNDLRAAEFQLQADDGHSYAHHLYIEHSLNYTRPGGYLFFLIPNDLFDTKEAGKLHQFLKETAHIQGVFQLPISLFQDERAAKSILVIQKQKEGVKPPKEILLAKLPKFSNEASFQQILSRVDNWFKENKQVDS